MKPKNKQGKVEKMYRYDKFGKLRTVKEANLIDVSPGYCSKCRELIIDSNIVPDGAFKIKHRVCKNKKEVLNERSE